MLETTVRVRRSQVIDGEPSRVWSLLSSPEAWSLRPQDTFMFNVPNAERLRFYIGPTPQGTGPLVVDICEELPGKVIKLRFAGGRQVFTLSVEPGRRGTTKASVEFSDIVLRHRKIYHEEARRTEAKAWLSALRAVIEGRAPWPKAQMPPDLRQKCLARPQMEHSLSVSRAVLISAAPSAVWNVVRSPETAQGSYPVDHSGYVPGTPRGEAGEVQYYIFRRSNGERASAFEAVTQTAHQRSALVQTIGLGQHIEGHLLVTPESRSGPTRLDKTCRWHEPEPSARTAEAARSQVAEGINKMISDYKSLLEDAANQA